MVLRPGLLENLVLRIRNLTHAMIQDAVLVCETLHREFVVFERKAYFRDIAMDHFIDTWISFITTDLIICVL